MRILVDMELCQNHGQCVYVAPDLFWFEGEELKFDAAPPDAFSDRAHEAAEACPEQAIVVED